MRKLHLLLSVTMLTVTVQAQNEAKENTTLSTEKKELLAQSGKVVPYPLQVAYDQTTHLIFPASIRYVDLGSENLVADKVKDAENVLRVKAAKTDFTDSTNLSVITQDGGFYSFEVSYHTTPQPLNGYIQTLVRVQSPLIFKGKMLVVTPFSIDTIAQLHPKIIRKGRSKSLCRCNPRERDTFLLG